MADSPTIERRTTSAEAATVDPIMREPVVLWMAEKVAGLDPNEAAPHIRSSLDAIAGAESSGGRNTTGVANKNTGNRALGNYQWFPVPFKEDLEALDIYLRKAAGVEKKDWTTPDWITEAIEHRDPRKLSDHKQDLVQMARITRLAKNDDITKMWMGDIPALRDFYAIKHHTQGYEDEATLRQMDKYMPLPDDYSPIAEPPELEQYADLNSPEKLPSNPAVELGNLNIEDYDPETTPLGASDFDFDRANRGMLSEITDLPTRRGGGEILSEADVPRRRGMFPEVTNIPRRRSGSEILSPASVDAKRRGGSEILNPAVTEARRRSGAEILSPANVEARRRSGAEILREKQAQSTRVDPTPPRAPELEEAVPTQRGQAPVPERAPVNPERVVGSEPRLESELASQMMSDGVGSTEPASPEQILSSPEEVSLGVNITTPRIDRASVQDYPEPTVTVDSEYPISQEAIEVEGFLQFEKPESSPPSNVSQQLLLAADDEIRRLNNGATPDVDYAALLDAAEEDAKSTVPDDRESSVSFIKRNTARNLANYGSLNTYDYIESGLRSLMGEDYDDAFKSIRDERKMLTQAYPMSQLAGEVGAGGLTGNALFNAGKRIAGPAGITSLELGTYMGLSGDTNQERLELATMGGIMGFGLGGVVHLATRPAKQDKPSARTAVDDELDDDILEQSIDASIKNKSTVLYRTNGDELKRVTVVKRIKKRNKLNEDGTYKFTDKRYARQEPEVLVRDEAGNEFVVLDSKIERVNLTGVDSKKFEQNMKFENSNYQFKPARQVLREKYNEDGSIMLTKEGEELLARGEAVNPSMVQYELRDATWRDARTTGELWDSLVEGGKKLYADLVRGTDDTLYQKVSKQVGNFYQVASTAAGRQTTKDFVGIGQPLTVLSKAIDKDPYLKALIGDVTNRRALIQKYKGTQYERWIIENVTEGRLRTYIAKNYGEENAKAWDAYLAWNRQKKEVHVEYLSGMKQFLPSVSPDVHIHMSLTKEAREKALNLSKKKYGRTVEYNPLSRDDSALEKRTRGSFLLGLDPKVSGASKKLTDAPSVDDYLNPVFTDFRRTANLEQLYQIAKKFALKMPDLDSGEQAYKVFQRLEEDMIRRGIKPQAAKYAAKLMSDDFVGSTRTPNGWLQALNSVGYAGSLAGFKSAVLNLHDIPMAAVLYGPSSFKGLAKVKGINVSDQGIRQNVGEFRDMMIESMRTGQMTPEAYAARVTRKGTDILMNLTGFSWFDNVGKNSISKMIVQNAVDTVDELEKRWGFYFDERQLAVLKSQIRKHGTDLTQYSKQGSELMEELFFAGLGQQQLISMSGRPAAWARHPNFRMMWALRGFAIKQLALAEKNVVDNILEGNIKEAVDYMKNYVIFAAGSFGLLNEARQWMWGDGNFTVGGVLMGMGDQIISTASINTIGLNDYQWGRMMRNGVALTFLESLVPIGIDIPKDIVLNIADAADGSVKNVDNMTAGQRLIYPAAQFPILKQTGRMFDNLADTNLFGLPIQAPLPQPLDDINRRYLLTENGPRESDG